jgi:hypothetical protein
MERNLTSQNCFDLLTNQILPTKITILNFRHPEQAGHRGIHHSRPYSSPFFPILEKSPSPLPPVLHFFSHLDASRCSIVGKRGWGRGTRCCRHSRHSGRYMCIITSCGVPGAPHAGTPLLPMSRFADTPPAAIALCLMPYLHLALFVSVGGTFAVESSQLVLADLQAQWICIPTSTRRSGGKIICSSLASSMGLDQQHRASAGGLFLVFTQSS